MDTLDKKTLIVGCGMAGLSLAVIFRKYGIQADIVERAPGLEPVETGMLLNQHTLGILRELGMFRNVQRAGYAVGRGRIFTEGGDPIAYLDLRGVRPHYGKTVSILRSDLHEAFVRYLGKLNVRFQTTVESLRREKDSVFARFTDGTEREYSLVIGSDGVGSKVRKLVFPEAKVSPLPYRACRFLVEGVDANQDVISEYWGSGRRLGVVPLGNGKFYCYGIMNIRQENLYKNLSDGERIRHLYKDFKGVVPHILERLPDEKDILFNSLEKVICKTWVKNRVVLVGDAAHAISPNLGQGAALAIEDAARLCQNLSFSNTPDQGLAQFQRVQWPRVRAIQRYTSFVGAVGQLQGFPAQIRDAVIKGIPNYFLIKLLEPAFIKD